MRTAADATGKAIMVPPPRTPTISTFMRHFKREFNHKVFSCTCDFSVMTHRNPLKQVRVSTFKATWPAIWPERHEGGERGEGGRQRGKEQTLALARSSISHQHHSVSRRVERRRIEETKFIFRPSRRRNRGKRNCAGISTDSVRFAGCGRYAPSAPATQNASSFIRNAGMIGSAWLPRAGRCDS